MKVKVFVENYKNLATDDLMKKYLTKNLKVKNYIGFAKKCDLCSDIIRRTSHKLEDGRVTNEIFINSPARYLFYTLFIIHFYTELEIDMSSAMEEYDLLAECGLIEEIIGMIPEREQTEFSTILNMTLDDFIENNMSTQTFIKEQIKRFGDLLGGVITPTIDSLEESLSNMSEKDQQKIVKRIFAKKNKN